MTNKKRVLLVDDERNLTQMLSMLLETRGYDVQIACSGYEALQKASPTFDLIILDLVPHFQPIYLFQPFKLLGIELLARPVSDGFLASPEKFFKEALKYGMYSDMEILSWSLALPMVARGLKKDQKIFLNCNPYFIESI